MGMDKDDVVIIPLNTFQRRISGNVRIPLITVAVEPGSDIERVKESSRLLLRERRSLSSSEMDNFNILDTSELIETISKTTQVLTMLLGAVAAVSLLVGGIGIMNIMLVSVTERTKEIGVRLAIGATEREVLLQFLVESIMLACFGGLLGVILAFGASVLLTHFMGVPLFSVPASTCWHSALPRLSELFSVTFRPVERLSSIRSRPFATNSCSPDKEKAARGRLNHMWSC